MTTRVLILGAGFGGLELSTTLAEALSDEVEITLIDKADSFVFGFSKLDVMFAKRSPEAVRLHYRDLAAPRVRFRQETVTSIDPEARTVVTDLDTYEADVLVVALGADLDPADTPGLVEAGNEFYTVAGAERLRDVIATFTHGHAVVGVTSAPFKCPPAPSEAAFLLDAYLREHGHRDACDISVVIPFGMPIPPSPETSKAIVAGFADRGITFVPDRLVRSLDADAHEAVLDDDTRMPYDLFLGVPRHRVPEVVAASGMTVDGWVPVDPSTLATSFPGVYAVGDVTSVGTPKAGVFAEGAARVLAANLIAQIRGRDGDAAYDGTGSCYIEFGDLQVARVDVDFFSGPSPTGTFVEPSEDLAIAKALFRKDRAARWFGELPGRMSNVPADVRTVQLGEFTAEHAELIVERLEVRGIVWWTKQPGWVSQIWERGVWLFVDKERLDEAREVADSIAT